MMLNDMQVPSICYCMHLDPWVGWEETHRRGAATIEGGRRALSQSIVFE